MIDLIDEWEKEKSNEYIVTYSVLKEILSEIITNEFIEHAKIAKPVFNVPVHTELVNAISFEMLMKLKQKRKFPNLLENISE